MSKQMTYEQCLRTMYGLRRFGIILGLDAIRNILADLGNPHRKYKCIHVAGTNGKGSIASALASILHTCGFKTGLYTSPHLVRFNERIRIDGKPIADQHVVEAYQAVKASASGSREPTFFEYSTAMAFYEFGRRNVDWAVIETGLGGRLDATNIVAPEVSIISNISIEHKMYLGGTIAAIAAEKAGIIKPDTPVVTGVRQKAAVDTIREVARSNSAPLYRYGEKFRVRRTSAGTFNYFGVDHEWRNVRTPLMGNYQVDNTALVLAACEVLAQKGSALPEERIKAGLKSTHWPGRLEVVCRSPLVILDGAHNLMAARNLARFLAANLEDRKMTLVVGILDDKPYPSMLKDLLPLCTRVIVTQAQIDRALPPETLQELAQLTVTDTIIVRDVAEAVKHALQTVDPTEAVCIAGSLYVVGEAQSALQRPDIAALLPE